MFGFTSYRNVFDDIVHNLLGTDLNTYFSDLDTVSYKKRAVTTNGHTIVSIEKNSPIDGKTVENYIDGEKYESLPDWAREALKDTRALSWKPKQIEPTGCNNKLPQSIVQGTSAPPLNMYHLEDGSLKLEFALAGVPVDDVEIFAENDYLTISTVDRAEANEEDTRSVCLQKGIRNTSGKLWKKVFIDPTKYDITKADYETKFGMWTVRIPKMKELQSKRVSIKSID